MMRLTITRSCLLHLESIAIQSFAQYCALRPFIFDQKCNTLFRCDITNVACCIDPCQYVRRLPLQSLPAHAEAATLLQCSVTDLEAQVAQL
jgi:hypothetical protein